MSDRGSGTGLPDADLQRFARGLARASARQGWFERALRVVVRGWCRLVGWHIDVRGVEALRRHADVPGAGCMVVAAPHRAWVEPFLLFAAWPTDGARLAWLADGRTVTRSWWRRHLLPRLGVIPVTGRVAGPRAYAALATQALAAGRAVAVFPEVGPPSPTDEARPFAAGFAYLAIAAGAPVLPVVIGGTHRIVRGSPFSVDFAEPEDPGPAAADPFTPAVRERAQLLRQRVEQVIAELLPARTTQADVRAPSRARWRWLGSLFD